MNKLYFSDNLDILREHIADTERPRYPDLSLGHATFKKAQVEDLSGEQGKLL
jgi:hypothetical protein